MKILIITGGRLFPGAGEALRSFAPDRILAADLGVRHCMTLGVVPDLAMGDFDSADPEAMDYLAANRVQRETFPPEKDDTDTELVLHRAMELAGPDGEILLFGAAGTRLDHTLANLCLLKQPADRGVACEIMDDHNRIRMVKGPAKVTLNRDAMTPYLSILPAFGDAEGVTLAGVYYPLEDARLAAGNSLGISNRITEQTACIRVEKGYLLIFRTRD